MNFIEDQERRIKELEAEEEEEQERIALLLVASIVEASEFVDGSREAKRVQARAKAKRHYWKKKEQEAIAIAEGLTEPKQRAIRISATPIKTKGGIRIPDKEATE